MYSPPSGPGKTAPKIYNDFLIFDPLNANGNFLSDHAPSVGEGRQLGPPIGSCKHEYAVKTEQSLPPPLDLRPDGTTKYKLATVCKKCRVHAAIRIDYTRSTNPCPNPDYPLHHFQRLPSEDAVTTDRIRYVWQCSAPQCQARLEISYRQKRLADDDKDLLTNTERLKRRYEATVQQDPSREGVQQATPMDALSRLRTYLRDALNPTRTRRNFPANNKRFMEAFGVDGQDCRELLERLGFTYADNNWHLPNPAEIYDQIEADGSSQRELLEDVRMELLALMYKVASESGAVNTAASEGWSSANRDVERVLAAQGYQRNMASRRSASANEQLPYFASLGALPDFADTLVIFAYERQANCDPERTPYYIECLQVVTDSRSTEQLQTKLVMLQSEGQMSARDIRAAYQYLDISGGVNAGDDFVLANFQSRQQNVSAATAAGNRDALYKIGVSRNSQLLINASRELIETYEDALAWIGEGATKDTSDEFLLSFLAVKDDTPANKELAKKAISVVARERQSNLLNNWVLTGRTDGINMSVDEALRWLSISMKLEDIPDDMLQYQIESARMDRPGEQTEKAIAAIEQALSGKASTAPPPTGSDSWPVGLQSHGNTCYLNSLLQYYFAVKPFRDIILDYDSYKLDTAAHSEKAERVGQRKISPVEIKGGQRFAKDLQELFRRMFKSAHSSVKPENDLVCRAFLEPKDYALLASSVIEEQGSGADDVVDAADVKLDDVANGQQPDQDASPSKSRQESDASSVTLQASVNGDEEAAHPKAGGDMPPTPPPEDEKLDGDQQQPSHAPPLPPRIRRFSTTEEVKKAQEQALKEAEKKATEQQDVAEVHDSVMFRLRAGMNAQGVDESGEQRDGLRDYYAIVMSQTTLNAQSAKGTASKPLLDSSIQVDVPLEPTDIYTALDKYFDPQEVGGSSDLQSYKSVQKLPAILQISVPRIAYDKTKGAYKSTATVKLEDELFMDRYCDDSHPDVLPSRQRSWGWRKQLHALQEELRKLKETAIDVDGPSAISETASYLNRVQDINKVLEDVDMERIDLDDDLSASLDSAAKDQTERLAALDKEITALKQQLDSQFKDLKALEYRLAAVFFHRGSSGGGHYWVCIHDFANNIWRKYNDELVMEVTARSMNEIFEASSWQDGTPTYVVYVADDRKNELIQPVCRDPEKLPEPLPAPSVQWKENDVPMKDDGDFTHVDPKMVSEGGQASWDPSRQVVADTSCLSTAHDLLSSDMEKILAQDPDLSCEMARYNDRRWMKRGSKGLTPPRTKRSITLKLTDGRKVNLLNDHDEAPRGRRG